MPFFSKSVECSTAGTAEQSSAIERTDVAVIFMPQPDSALPKIREQPREHEGAVRVHHLRSFGRAGEDDPTLVTRLLSPFMLHDDVVIKV
jgi:hypothetical protein